MVQKYRLLLAIFCMFLFKTSWSYAGSGGDKDCRHSPSTFSCVDFVGNYDGDTITVNIPKVHYFFGHEVSVRVRGVNTGELRSVGPCQTELGILAAQYTKNLLSRASEIHLVNASRGKYFRVVADVIFDGKSLANELIDKKLGVSYDQRDHTPVDWCALLDSHH